LVKDSQSEKTDEPTATGSLDADWVIEVEGDRLWAPFGWIESDREFAIVPKIAQQLLI
jgi:hypothetical protein